MSANALSAPAALPVVNMESPSLGEIAKPVSIYHLDRGGGRLGTGDAVYVYVS